MPVTKKKGAIFAVYADTPPRSLSSSASSSSSSSVAKRSGSPTKSSMAPRRALAQLPPTAAKSASALEPKVLRSVSGLPEPTKEISKKPLGVKPLSAKPLSAKPLSASGMTPLASKPLAVKKPLAGAKPLRGSAGSVPPPRRFGAVPAPTSSTKPLRAGSGRTFQIFTDETVPIPPTQNVSPKLAPPPVDADDKENSAPRRPLASKPLGSKTGVAPLGGVTKKIPSKQPPRSRPVFSVLLDASEAYGASGPEPVGFRDVLVSVA